MTNPRCELYPNTRSVQDPNWVDQLHQRAVYGFTQQTNTNDCDALTAFKDQLRDPDDVLQSWDSTLLNHCAWFHVTCNSDLNVIRVDLADSNLSGHLVPQLGKLTRLESLMLFDNNISGRIPKEIGNLTNLLTLDLQFNRLDGVIPDSLGKLQKLRHLLLNNNSLTGTIPISLTAITSLQILDLSNNDLSGDLPVNGSFSRFTSVGFAGNPKLRASTVLKRTTPRSSHSRPVESTGVGAIVVGYAAGATLVLFGVAIALVWWRRRKPQVHFYDGPGQ